MQHPSLVVTIKISLFLVWLLAGCATSREATTTNNTTTSTAEASAMVSTFTEGPEPILSPVPTIAPSQTPTKSNTPTATYTSTIMPTWTPLATLVPNEAESLYEELLQTNAGCLLPCWWGIIPGKTTWPEASSFLLRFAQLEGQISPMDPSLLVMWALFPLSSPVDVFTRQEQLYLIRDGVVESIDIELRGDREKVKNYRLSNFLQTFGPPTEIWLSTYSTEYPAGVLPFQAALFYPERGILAIYWPQQADFVGEFVRGCQWDKPPSMFGLWAPEQNMTFLEAARHFRMNPDEPGFLLLPIEEATGMDPQTFFEMFSSPDNLACLETPKEIWPEQQ